jgi:hypothetical protein
MACENCQKRREAIARMAARVGTIVFGRKRVLAAAEKPEEKSGRDKKRGKSRA